MDDVSPVGCKLLVGCESQRVGNHSLLHDEVRGVEKGEEESREEDSENGLVHEVEYEGEEQERKVIGGVNLFQKTGAGKKKDVRKKKN